MLPSQALPQGAGHRPASRRFHKANIARYQRPERRTIRYVLVDEAAIKNLGAPSDADIQKRYQANAALYAAERNPLDHAGDPALRSRQQRLSPPTLQAARRSRRRLRPRALPRQDRRPYA
jgi:hypothetical protein